MLQGIYASIHRIDSVTWCVSDPENYVLFLEGGDNVTVSSSWFNQQKSPVKQGGYLGTTELGQLEFISEAEYLTYLKESLGEDEAMQEDTPCDGIQAGIVQHFITDSNGNPAGGVSQARGILVAWQNGPLGTGAERQEPNGAFVEDVIKIALGRLEFYQDSKFNCEENAIAINSLRTALQALRLRTAKRELRGVEGTHEV